MYVIGTLPVLLTFKFKINFACSLLNVVFVTFIKILHMYVADHFDLPASIQVLPKRLYD